MKVGSSKSSSAYNYGIWGWHIYGSCLTPVHRLSQVGQRKIMANKIGGRYPVRGGLSVHIFKRARLRFLSQEVRAEP